MSTGRDRKDIRTKQKTYFRKDSSTHKNIACD